MTTRPRIRAILMGVVAMGTMIAPARAESTDAMQKTARKACLAGDYTKGVELLADLFVETKNPTHIFNQGRCFEQNARYEEAISRFREYLRIGSDLGQEDVAIANKHIADCRALLGKSDIESSPPTAPVPAPAAATQSFSAASPPAALATPPGIDVTASTAPVARDDAGAPMYKRWWFWTGVGAVVAGTVTAVVLAKGGSATLTASSSLGTRAVFQ